MSENKLPTIQDLYKNETLEINKQEDKMNVLLNQPPKKEWIRARDKYKYLPIERIEWLLSYVFIHWFPEVKLVQLLGNAIQVTVRLHYKHPLSGEYRFVDGVGAFPLQTAQGAGATDFSKLNHAAVQLATPAAKTEAIKDAAHHLGRLFGKDLNRDAASSYNYANRFDNLELKEKAAEFTEALKHCQDMELHSELIAEAFENEGKETVEMYQKLIDKLNGKK